MSRQNDAAKRGNGQVNSAMAPKNRVLPGTEIGLHPRVHVQPLA